MLIMADDSDYAEDGYHGCVTEFCGLCLFPFDQSRRATVTSKLSFAA